MFIAQTRLFLEKYFIFKGISRRKVELEEIQKSQSSDTPIEEQELKTQEVVEEKSSHVEQD